ncbi:MAG: Asp-tRNA(Asn)/Glu-tRNA(Gln) amidotransferase subunit GatC [Planctomycetota bacterium]
MEITDKLIDHLCFLSRLSLSPDEKKRLKDDLTKILSYVDTVKKVDVAGVEPLVHSSAGSGNVWRADAPGKDSLPPDKALQNAPQKRGNFFEVPRVIE